MKDYSLHVISAPPGKEGYCVVDFILDGVPYARRSFKGHSYLYAEDAGINWVNGILREQHFTMEDFLLAGAHHGS